MLRFSNDTEDNLIYYNCVLRPYNPPAATSHTRVNTKFWGRSFVRGAFIAMGLEEYQSFLHDAMLRGNLTLTPNSCKRLKDEIGNNKPCYRYEFQPDQAFLPTNMRRFINVRLDKDNSVKLEFNRAWLKEISVCEDCYGMLGHHNPHMLHTTQPADMCECNSGKSGWGSHKRGLREMAAGSYEKRQAARRSHNPFA